MRQADRFSRTAALLLAAVGTAHLLRQQAVAEDAAPYERAANLSAAPVAQAWRVDPVPLVDIGRPFVPQGRAAGGGGAANPPIRLGRNLADAADSTNHLADVRGVVRLRDGRIAVAEGKGNIKFFDGTGRYLTTVTASATGLRSLAPYRGDSLLVVTESVTRGRSVLDSATGTRETFITRSVSALVLDASGSYGRTLHIVLPESDRTQRVGWEDESHEPVGSLADGSIVVRSTPLGPMPGPLGPREGTATYFQFAPDGNRPDTIATLVVADYEKTREVAFVQPIFRKEAPRAAFHDRFMYWGTGDNLQVTIFDLGSRARGVAPSSRVIGTAAAPRPAGESEREHYVRRLARMRVAGGGPPARAILEEIRARVFRPTLPTVRNLLVDDTGLAWLEHFRVTMPLPMLVPDTSDIPRWTVLRPAGAPAVDVSTPPGLVVVAIGVDWILGTWTDPLGTTHVRLHRLFRN